MTTIKTVLATVLRYAAALAPYSTYDAPRVHLGHAGRYTSN